MKPFLSGFLIAIVGALVLLGMTDTATFANYRERIFGQESAGVTYQLGDCWLSGHLTVYGGTGTVESELWHPGAETSERLLLTSGETVEGCS